MKLMKQRQNIFFTSDLHFYHKPILRPDFSNRPFADLDAMCEAIIENWNRIVKPGDIVIVVGDVFFCGTTKAREIMARLNGTKVLVTGNHDGNYATMMNAGFDFVCEKLVLKIADQEVLISHYPYKYKPLRQWFHKWILRSKTPRYMDRRPENRGGWLIHGHTHSTERVNGKMIHVGCDAWNYTPVPISVIERIIQTGSLDGKPISRKNHVENVNRRP